MNRLTSDPTLNAERINLFFNAIEPLYDAITGSSKVLPPRELQLRYVTRRVGETDEGLREMLSRLPPALRPSKERVDPESAVDAMVGRHEADLIDFLINYREASVLVVCGHRGVGKSTFVRAVRHVLETYLRKRICFPVLDANGLSPEHFSNPKNTVTEICGSLEGAFAKLPFAESNASLFADIQMMLRDPHARSLDRILAKLRLHLEPSGLQDLVFVFDNLDHLSRHSLQNLFETAKRITERSGYKVVLCLRPGSIPNIAADDGRATFHFRIDLAPPAFPEVLVKLADAAARALQQRESEGLGELEFEGNVVTPEMLTGFFRNLAKLFDRSMDAEKVGIRGVRSLTHFLDSISAEDHRQRLRLLRRLLRHRDFPVADMLNGSTPEHYYALNGLFEGDRLLYAETEDLVNVLFCSEAHGDAQLLIFHRILTLVQVRGEIRGISVRELVDGLGTLEYLQDDILAAVETLHKANIVRFRDQETSTLRGMPGWEQTEVRLTTSSAFYHGVLFCATAYLSIVICDVPMQDDGSDPTENPFIKGLDFLPRFRRLLLHAQRVREAEQRELNRLKRANASLVTIDLVQGLMQGNTLCDLLVGALQSVANRRSVQSVSLNRFLDRSATTEILRNFEAGIRADKQVLGETMQRLMRNLPNQLPVTAEIAFARRNSDGSSILQKGICLEVHHRGPGLRVEVFVPALRNEPSIVFDCADAQALKQTVENRVLDLHGALGLPQVAAIYRNAIRLAFDTFLPIKPQEATRLSWWFENEAIQYATIVSDDFDIPWEWWGVPGDFSLCERLQCRRLERGRLATLFKMERWDEPLGGAIVTIQLADIGDADHPVAVIDASVKKAQHGIIHIICHAEKEPLGSLLLSAGKGPALADATLIASLMNVRTPIILSVCLAGKVLRTDLTKDFTAVGALAQRAANQVRAPVWGPIYYTTLEHALKLDRALREAKFTADLSVSAGIALSLRTAELNGLYVEFLPHN